MSSTRNPGNERDTHPTPAWAVRRLLEERPLPVDRGQILEPCAGDGAIIRAANTGRWIAVELRTAEEVPRLIGGTEVDAFTGADIFAPETKYVIARPTPCFAITNPPFAIAERLVRYLYGDLQIPTCLLLPLNWLGSDKRAAWFRKAENRPDLYVLPDRPSFTPDGKTDSLYYAWMVWDPMNARRPTWTVLGTTSLEERRADRIAQFGPKAPTTTRGVELGGPGPEDQGT